MSIDWKMIYYPGLFRWVSVFFFIFFDTVFTITLITFKIFDQHEMYSMSNQSQNNLRVSLYVKLASANKSKLIHSFSQHYESFG